MQSVKEMRRQIFWGAAALIMVVVIGVGAAFVYVSPPKQQIVAFYTDDSASIHPGDTVRVAGIVVGKVKDLSIEPDRVRVRVSVDQDVFIGDQSQIEVRMLTVVGGYYVTVIPLGDSPLGNRVIPRERARMPYSLIRTLTDATKITERVSAKPIRATIDEIQQGLAGDNTAVVTDLINSGNSIAETMDRQRGQISAILDMSNEYLKTANQNPELLQYMISRMAIFEETLIIYGKGFWSTLNGLADVGNKLLDPLTRFYMPHRYDFLAKVRGILQELRTIADRNGVVVRVLSRIRGRMEAAVAAQNESTRPELLATDLCIPVEGSAC